MKLTPTNRKIISFMSGPWGRAARVFMGSFLLFVALSNLGWSLLWLPLGMLMIATGLLNYCPAGLLFPQWKKEQQLLTNFPTYKLKK
ncbi:MAG: DUF2892 domain-containing protein [Aquiluna sp.]|nr:DUF2892 domain-containing protein [Aquiluna sp.]MCF8545948.1 DUF2892 domain-containing protein [Aquiluna sp.]